MRVAAMLAIALLAGQAALAGGPLGVRSNGLPFVWSTAAPIQYRTDDGPLSATVNEAAARARVLGMFDVWQNVPTASIGYNRAGFINATGAFSDGDVSTALEYGAVSSDCQNGMQSPVIYDADGTIMVDLGRDVNSVIGFAGPCASNATQFVAGEIVMNGRFQDGQGSPNDIPAADFDAALIHEIGHFSGLDHSQVNVNCLSFCGPDDLAGLPTMFPFLIGGGGQGALSVDDIAWISRLYPQLAGGTTFANTHGTITGIVFFSDGESHAQLVNVIARRVNTGSNEDRTMAVSALSGQRFSTRHGNDITNDPGNGSGNEVPGDIGLYEIPVPAGSYMVEVESIAHAFIAGSSIGTDQIAMPGTAPPPIGPIAVAAGSTVSGNNVTLIGTPPRFDQFEGP